MLGEFLDHAMVLVHAWLFTEKGTRFFLSRFKLFKKGDRAIALFTDLLLAISAFADCFRP